MGLYGLVMYLIGLLPLYNSESWLNETLWSSDVFNWFIASVQFRELVECHCLFNYIDVGLLPLYSSESWSSVQRCGQHL